VYGWGEKPGQTAGTIATDARFGARSAALQCRGLFADAAVVPGVAEELTEACFSKASATCCSSAERLKLSAELSHLFVLPSTTIARATDAPVIRRR